MLRAVWVKNFVSRAWCVYVVNPALVQGFSKFHRRHPTISFFRAHRHHMQLLAYDHFLFNYLGDGAKSPTSTVTAKEDATTET